MQSCQIRWFSGYFHLFGVDVIRLYSSEQAPPLPWLLTGLSLRSNNCRPCCVNLKFQSDKERNETKIALTILSSLY